MEEILIEHNLPGCEMKNPRYVPVYYNCDYCGKENEMPEWAYRKKKKHYCPGRGPESCKAKAQKGSFMILGIPPFGIGDDLLLKRFYDIVERRFKDEV